MNFNSYLKKNKRKFIYFKNLVLSILNPAPMTEKFNRNLLKMADVICPNQTEVILSSKFNFLICFFFIDRSFM